MYSECMCSSTYTLRCYKSDSWTSKQTDEPWLRWNLIYSVIYPILLRNLAAKVKSRHAKKNFFDQNFFFSKIISNHHICLQTWFLRCLELPWKLWKQRIYVKTSILLKIRFFEQTLVKKSHFLAWRSLFMLPNALGPLQSFD